MTCYPFYLFEARKISSANDSPVITYTSAVDPDTEEILDQFLEPVAFSTWALTLNLDKTYAKKPWPWAIALFNREFRLGGHLLALGDKKEGIAFSTYSERNADFSVVIPPVGLLLIKTKEGLRNSAPHSELIQKAWEELMDKSEDHNWICTAESPSEKWVEEVSKDDDELFRKIYNEKNLNKNS